MSDEPEAIIRRDSVDPRVRIAEALERIADDLHKIVNKPSKNHAQDFRNIDTGLRYQD